MSGTGTGTPAPSTAALCTLTQVKARVQIGFSGNDEQIDTLIDAVLPTVTARYGCEFMPQTTGARIFDFTSRLVPLMGSDLRSVTSVVLDPNGTPKTLTEGVDYVLVPCRLTGTFTEIRLADQLVIASAFSRSFGFAQLEVTGEWGIWGTTADVPANIQQAAVECVLSWLSRPVSQVAGIDATTIRTVMPEQPSTWDIPASAHRKFAPYNRNFGVH